MDNQETKCSGQAVVLAFLGGAVAGVVAGQVFFSLLSPGKKRDEH